MFTTLKHLDDYSRRDALLLCKFSDVHFTVWRCRDELFPLNMWRKHIRFAIWPWCKVE